MLGIVGAWLALSRMKKSFENRMDAIHEVFRG